MENEICPECKEGKLEKKIEKVKKENLAMNIAIFGAPMGMFATYCNKEIYQCNKCNYKQE